MEYQNFLPFKSANITQNILICRLYLYHTNSYKNQIAAFEDYKLSRQGPAGIFYPETPHIINKIAIFRY